MATFKLFLCVTIVSLAENSIPHLASALSFSGYQANDNIFDIVVEYDELSKDLTREIAEDYSQDVVSSLWMI